MKNRSQKMRVLIFNSIRNRAFTLAEVLITLGIIGIVAVMTIPNLVTDIQEKEWATASDTFIKKLEAAMKVMNTEDVLTGYETTEEFANELSRYFKINNVCQNTALNKCFSETIVMGDDKTKKVTTSIMEKKTFWNNYLV